jgi:cathepsin B
VSETIERPKGPKVPKIPLTNLVDEQVRFNEVLTKTYPLGHTKAKVEMSVRADVDLSASPPPESYNVFEEYPSCVSAVHDQGVCGSCYAFSTTTMLSVRQCMRKGDDPMNGWAVEELSAQSLVSCGSQLNITNGKCGEEVGYYAQACDGGNGGDLLQFISVYGVDTEAVYPYTAGGSEPVDNFDATGELIAPCDFPKAMKHQTAGEETHTFVYAVGKLIAEGQIMAEIMAGGPVYLAFEVYGNLFDHTNGVHTPDTVASDYQGLHSVVAYGWGTEDDGTPYWLCQNSWGQAWGEGGRFKLQRGKGLVESAYYGSVDPDAKQQTDFVEAAGDQPACFENSGLITKDGGCYLNGNNQCPGPLRLWLDTWDCYSYATIPRGPYMGYIHSGVEDDPCLGVRYKIASSQLLPGYTGPAYTNFSSLEEASYDDDTVYPEFNAGRPVMGLIGDGDGAVDTDIGDGAVFTEPAAPTAAPSGSGSGSGGDAGSMPAASAGDDDGGEGNRMSMPASWGAGDDDGGEGSRMSRPGASGAGDGSGSGTGSGSGDGTAAPTAAPSGSGSGSGSASDTRPAVAAAAGVDDDALSSAMTGQPAGHGDGDGSGQLAGDGDGAAAAAVANDGEGGPPEHCTDGNLDYGETDIDCGNLCSGCAAGLHCVMDTDCISGVCEADNTCADTPPPEHCTDGNLDYGETDIDCGNLCSGCAAGLHCVMDTDCISGVCDTAVGVSTCASDTRRSAPAVAVTAPATGAASSGQNSASAAPAAPATGAAASASASASAAAASAAAAQAAAPEKDGKLIGMVVGVAVGAVALGLIGMAYMNPSRIAYQGIPGGSGHEPLMGNSPAGSVYNAFAQSPPQQQAPAPRASSWGFYMYQRQPAGGV